MILSDLLYYLLRLVKSGHYWQYTNINGQGVKPKHWFSNIQLFIIALSLLCTLLNPLGFNKDFYWIYHYCVINICRIVFISYCSDI